MTSRADGCQRRMLTRKALAVGAAALVVSACGDGGGSNNTLPCGIDTGNSSIAGGLSVAYTASLSGAGSVTSITYTDNSGDVVVTNPTLPFQASVTLATLPARIRASGSVTTGAITIGYNATGAPARQEQDSQTCQQTNN
jgi:hypothetical protein